jgi:hypothetical protein
VDISWLGAVLSTHICQFISARSNPIELPIFEKRLERLTSIELFTVLTEQYRKKK